jgi:hypothetical protein
MSTFGPKGPTDASAAMAKVLQFRRPEAENKVESTTSGHSVQAVPGAQAVEDVKDVKANAGDVTSKAAAAVFDGGGGTATVGSVSAPVEGAALSQLIARLRAKGDGQQVQATVGPTIIDTAEGKVLSGSVNIDTRQALHKLDGIVRFGGSVSVEGIIKNADLLAIRDVKVVEGRLTFEGMRSRPPSLDERSSSPPRPPWSLDD